MRIHAPASSDIRAARIAAGLTQTQAAELVHTACRTWQQWEAGDRRMHPAFWELFRRKAMSEMQIRSSDARHNHVRQLWLPAQKTML